MNKRKLNKRREFSEQIKKKVVSEFRDGKYRVKELANLYHCAPQTVYRWIYKYSPADQPQINVIEMSQSTDQKVKELNQKIADLEQTIGRKQMKMDHLEKMIELAEADYDIDLKKNLNGNRSSGSEATETL